MMGEYTVFSKLLATHGVPGIVIPNTPCCHFRKRNSGSCFIAEVPPADMGPFDTRVTYCRTPFGPEPFLRIRKYVELDERGLNGARPALITMGVAEILRGGIRRGPRGGIKPVVRIAVREDVTPLGACEFGAALEQRRILAVYSTRSMGDAYIRFQVATPVSCEDHAPLRFLFDLPCRLTDGEVAFAESDSSWESAATVLDDFREYFSRQLKT